MAGLLVAGTASDAGTSLVVTGLCRALARRGVRLAPYKAQNMSNNSTVVTAPTGGALKIGRAQWVQAAAARARPEVAMNPVLLKPGGDRRSHVVAMGRPAGEVSARDHAGDRRSLASVAHAAYDDLARHAGLLTVVVGDIDRGGVFAAFLGTVALLRSADLRLLEPGASR